ncbi:MAG: hypothetical protein RR436_03170 [Clostridia bacterium]
MEKITEDFRLLELGKEYNNKISYKENCDKNERFYAGDQWYGVKAGNLPTPVFNIFRRIIDYTVSFVLSSPLKIKYTATNGDLENSLNTIAENHFESNKMGIMLRDLLLDASLSGDMAVHTYWDKDITSGSGIMGDFVTETVDGINLYFGNVNDKRVEVQPYIIIAGRAMTKDLQKEALSLGITKQIASDEDSNSQCGDRSSIELSGKTTYIIKYFRDDDTGRIFFNKCTRDVILKENIDTGLYRYPICLANYTKRKNSYHGQAIGTNLAPNQIFINKIFAMAMKHTMDTAFPKAIYDKTRVSSWNNAIGSAIGVNGDVGGICDYVQPANMSSSVISLIDRAMRYTQDNMGAADVLLGQNITPDNASAIMALQKSAAVPLDNVRENLYNFVEDIALVWLEFIKRKYSIKREIVSSSGDCYFIDSKLTNENKITIKIDVGASTYWSELASVTTLSGLLEKGYITLNQYLERVPKGYIPMQSELIAEITATQENANLKEIE